MSIFELTEGETPRSIQPSDMDIDELPTFDKGKQYGAWVPISDSAGVGLLFRAMVEIVPAWYLSRVVIIGKPNSVGWKYMPERRSK